MRAALKNACHLEQGDRWGTRVVGLGGGLDTEEATDGVEISDKRESRAGGGGAWRLEVVRFAWWTVVDSGGQWWRVDTRGLCACELSRAGPLDEEKKRLWTVRSQTKGACPTSARVWFSK